MDYLAIQRAELLISQGRPSEAEKILFSVYSSMPDSDHIKYLLSECRYVQGDYKEALRYIDEAIGLFPELALYYAHKANVLWHAKQINEAFRNIEHAISLDPDDSYLWSIKSALLYEDQKYEKALDAANEGLAHNPEESVCLNIRSLSLAKLNRVEEANETIKDALQSNPNDSFTYASQGFIALQRGSSKEAMELFREALRINPGSGYAKSGLVEALKSRFFIYRWFYVLFDWIGRQGNGVQWALIIGIVVIRNISSSIAAKSPDLAPIFNTISLLLFLFILLSWIIIPLSNLLLRLNPYGKYALSKDQIQCSNWVGVLLLSSILLYACFWIFHSEIFILPALMALFSIIPINCIYSFKRSPDSKLVKGLSIGIIVFGFLSILLELLSIISLFPFFILLFIAYQLYMNKLMMKSFIE